MEDLKIGIDSADALRVLRRLADPNIFEQESLEGAMARVKQWVRYTDESLIRGDTYSAGACLCVVKKLLGIR